MQAFRHSRWRRPGAVLGLLAVLALCVLAPIHHVHAIQRDFGHPATLPVPAEGHHGAGAGHAQHGPTDQPAKPPVYCPICSLAKMAELLLPPSLPVVAEPAVDNDASPPLVAVPALAGRSAPAARPRAPPVHA